MSPVHEELEVLARRVPNAVAVVFGDDHLTYAELNRRANQLAHHLRRLGVGPEVIVGVCVDRSLEMIASVLAVLKAGGAFLPLDPSYPRDRLVFMLADSRASLVIANGGHLVEMEGFRRLSLDGVRDAI